MCYNVDHLPEPPIGLHCLTQSFDRTEHRVQIILENLGMWSVLYNGNFKVLPNTAQGPPFLNLFFPVFLINRSFQLYDHSFWLL